MRDQLEMAMWSVRRWIETEYDIRDERRHRHCLAVGLLPILASYVVVHMQQPQQQSEQSPVGTIGFLWHSATLGLSSLILSLWHLALRILGLSLGVGLGLGLAGHVYDALSDARDGDLAGTDGAPGGAPGRRRGMVSHPSTRGALPREPSLKTAKLKLELAGMDDGNSYHALMRGAGYAVDGGTLRAQMVRGPPAGEAMAANEAKRAVRRAQGEGAEEEGNVPRVSLYKFDKGTTAAERMKTLWPNLAPVVNEALAKLTEFVLRDYVSVWYSKLDEHVVYTDPGAGAEENASRTESSSEVGGSVKSTERRPSTTPAEGERRRTLSVTTEGSRTEEGAHSFSEGDDARPRPRSGSTAAAARSASLPTPTPQQRHRNPQQQRTMVLTATGTQPSPFVESLYACFAYLFGMLATRASENVNVLELLLLHFPHILAQNLRIYRSMRHAALEKKQRRIAAEREKWRKRGMISPSSSFERSGSLSPTQEGEVSEIAIVREYLLAGRFHRALTFGLDVPSLLFADPLAKDCPPGPSYQGNSDIDRLNGHPDEDAILEDRLLSPEASLIDECELDYNRVMAAKLTRLTVPKTEADSSVIRTLLVEILASCVLGPIMGCFCPDSVNGWIITGLGLLEDKGTEEAVGDAPENNNLGEATNASDGNVRINGDLETNQTVNTDPRIESSNGSIGMEGDLDSIVEDIASVGSVTSEMEASLFGFDDESTGRKDVMDTNVKAEKIITMLSMSIMELSGFVDFEDCRYAREHGQDCVIDWDAQNCRNSVRHLVLVIEAALLLGMRSHPKRQRSHLDRGISEFEIEATLDEGPDEDEFEVDLDDGLIESSKVKSTICQSHSSLSAALMELTGDIDAFERLVEDSEHDEDDESLEDESDARIFIPSPSELSTLRTLIAAWLHTGQAFKVLSIIVRAKKTILQRFYHRSAFLRRANYASDFTRLLRQLDGVDILVDTMAVLASQCLLVGNGFDTFMKSIQRQPPKTRVLHSNQEDPFPEMRRRQRPHANATNVNSMSVVGSVKANLAHNRDRIARFAQSATEIDLNPFKDKGSAQTRRSSGANIAYNQYQGNQSTPAYLAFSKNDVFASSLRSERERRMKSWLTEIKDKKKLDFVCRTKGVKDKDIMMHRELHHLSRFFYSNTNEVRIDPCSNSGDDQPPSGQSAANVTIKAVGTRRKIEVPDEDSSFLLRAQARPLKPVAIQRDQRNPNVACKVYVAMYEEPAIHPKTKRFYGGRYLRQCLMRYYPNDKTASVTVAQKISALDRREQEGSDKFVLTDDFQKLRHTCLKVATGGILSSPLMEPGDFCSTPRTGRAIDFAYRVSLFERPLVELGGKKFVIHDASSHRADASALELSDASLTAALMLRGTSGLNMCDSSEGNFSIKVSDEGSPLVLLRANRDGSSGSSPKTKDEARPYRPSFIRAALLVKSAKQEAQSQCLVHCIQTGSARSSSKVKSDEWLQPTLTLLQYANSRRQEEQSVLLRDLRFGMNHIDRGQLSRNGLLNPRYPTILRGLNTKVEGVVEVKTSDFDLLGTPLILFRIRCTAIAEYVGGDEEEEGDATMESKKNKGKTRYFREEWTVLRSLRDFGVFHKHIKGEVAPTEHSASTGAKLVGSVSAALTIVGGNAMANERQRGPLVPSLSQATKAGTLGLSTKKVMEKRKKLLDAYLKYLVSPKNLLSRCPELLKFLGAYTRVFPVEGDGKTVDEYGREDIRRVELVTEKLKAGIVQVKQGTEQVSVMDISTKESVDESVVASVASLPPKVESVDDAATVSTLGTTTATAQEEEPKLDDSKENQAARRMAMIRAGEIRLKDVRRSIFRLLKHLFDLDNASFFRSNLVRVLKTMSVAVASVQDFHRLLFQSHLTYMNGEWISGWIYYLVDTFWPNGVWCTKGPPMTVEELFIQRQNCKKKLEETFPDQLRTVLGRHTEEGLDLLHEMLQNRLVLKSMAYMILDVVWAELFPELSDFVTGAECLEKAD